MKIYLAGSVPKGDEEERVCVDWRKNYTEVISRHVENIELFDPNIFYVLEGDSEGVTGADCWSIQKSDLVVVNAEGKLGAGTAMELVIAKYLFKPVITVLPKDTQHRRSNVAFKGRIVEDWIHPFIDTFSDFIIDDITQIKDVIEKVKDTKIKNISLIDNAIQYAKNVLDEK